MMNPVMTNQFGKTGTTIMNSLSGLSKSQSRISMKRDSVKPSERIRQSLVDKDIRTDFNPDFTRTKIEFIDHQDAFKPTLGLHMKKFITDIDQSFG